MEDPSPGARIDDFTIAYRISRGMNADVFAVWHHGLLTPLACKRLRPADDARHHHAKWRRLLRAEGAALARLKHPGVVRLIYQKHETELPYLLLEHVGDRTLRDALKEDGPFEPSLAVRLVQHVGAAVAHAHSHGLIHRDLKPSNVVTRGGRVVLLDFGVVWKLGAKRRPPDRSGTPQYLAPEQIRRDPLTPATDVYGLGTMLYELLAGERPFGPGDEGADAPLAARYPQLLEPPKPFAEIGREIPEGLARVVEQCLAKDPSERFSRAADLLQALDLYTDVKVWPQEAAAAAAAAAANTAFDPFGVNS
ncbi:MAG: serine/threonine-protein kinase [Pyrinomonadaceae bacterium]